MKKIYEPATIEIIELEVQDILTASAPDEPFNGVEQPLSYIPDLSIEIPFG
jgi:hypothetical protein